MAKNSYLDDGEKRKLWAWLGDDLAPIANLDKDTAAAKASAALGFRISHANLHTAARLVDPKFRWPYPRGGNRKPKTGSMRHRQVVLGRQVSLLLRKLGETPTAEFAELFESGNWDDDKPQGSLL